MNLIFLWVAGASLLGFGIAAIFAGWLKLQRNVYLLFYIPLIAALFIAFMLSNDLNAKELIVHNWYWGLLGTAVVSLLVIKNVLSQPSSEANKGFALFTDVIWPGFAYGLCDALLLSVLPVLAIRLAFAEEGWVTGWIGSMGLGLISLISSCLVAFIYHVGYPEFRGKKVIWAIVGNGILTLAYIITMNPLAAILPHIAMHVTAMIHGRETTGQVPPHYN